MIYVCKKTKKYLINQDDMFTAWVSNDYFFSAFPLEKVVQFLNHPALPALLLPAGQQLFSANAICRLVILSDPA